VRFVQPFVTRHATPSQSIAEASKATNTLRDDHSGREPSESADHYAEDGTGVGGIVVAISKP
jgi:hypothetical protein